MSSEYAYESECTSEAEYTMRTPESTLSQLTIADSRAEENAPPVIAALTTDMEVEAQEIQVGRKASGAQGLTTEERLYRLEQKYAKLEEENRILYARLQAQVAEQELERT